MDIQQQQIEKQGRDGPSSAALQLVVLIWYFFAIYLLAGLAYSSFMQDATIAVSASIVSEQGRAGLHVEGQVVPLEPVTLAGKAYISVEASGGQRRDLLVAADLDENGRFSIGPNAEVGLAGLDGSNQIEVHVQGALASQDGYTLLHSEGDAFLNKKKPYSIVFKSAVISTILLLVFSFFTGPYKELDHRVLVTFSYVLIAVSIIAPFWLFYQGGDMLRPMETKAVGILQVGYHFPYTYRDSVDQNLEMERGVKVNQWVLNIGGIPQVPKHDNGQAEVNGTTLYDVYGGLVIPVFVLILALFGGAVRMAQLIPPLQSGFRYYEKINLMHVFLFKSGGIEEAGDQAQENGGSEAEANKTRGLIIQQITFLITSPVIAVAVYYMMMIINPKLVQSMPVVVILAFTAGFMTDKVLKALAEVGSGILDHGGWKPSGGGPASEEPAVKPARATQGKKPVKTP